MQPVKAGARPGTACWALVLTALHAAAAATTVQRCETADGKVTYSNTQCPAGTSPTRKVDTAPPVSVDEQKAAKERARQDSQAARQVDKQAEKQAEKQRAQEQSKTAKDATDRKKTETRTRERCDKALQELDRARDRRADLTARARTIEQEQKAETEVKRRETDAKRDCALLN